MKKLLAVSIAVLTLAGCTTAMSTANTPGRMSEGGTINPCQGSYADAEACGHAITNEKVIAQIQTGQTPADVTAIMRHAAERRVVNGEDESWGYITSYNGKVMTWIAFTDEKVSSVTQRTWVPLTLN